MCGIAGIVDFGQGIDIETNISILNNALANRGKDDEGTFFDRSEQGFALGLGHRRLSIIDLSAAGHQPFVFGNKVLVFNGEIYNYIEIKAQLTQLGYQFSTQTDTEVLATAYTHWGEACVEHLNGMWAFAIFDPQTSTLFCSRDRTGIKPFYYYFKDRVFVFASEIKAFLKLDFLDKTINQMAVFDYLAHGNLETQSGTFFQHIHELKPSHQFSFNLKTQQIDLKRYYDVWKSINQKPLLKPKKDINSISELVFEAVEQSVRLRLRSDVPIGASLSGGLDSSAVVALASGLLNAKNGLGNKKMDVFTAVSSDKTIDESRFAQLVVDRYGLQWHKILPKASDLPLLLPQIVYANDYPTLTTSTFAQFLVAKKVKEQSITIVLDGQGGDELFSGYWHHLPIFYAELFKKLSLKTLYSEIYQVKDEGFSSRYLLKYYAKQFAFGYLPNSIKTFAQQQFKHQFQFFNPHFVHQNSRLTNQNDHFCLHKSLNQCLADEITGNHLKNLARWVDRNGMNFGLETRLPLADDVNLIELALQIPAQMKIKDGWTKYMFRTAMQNHLPSQIVWRTDKKGFATPEKDWLIQNETYFKQLLAANTDLKCYIDTKKIVDNWGVLVHGGSAISTGFLYRCINFCVWKNVFLD